MSLNPQIISERTPQPASPSWYRRLATSQKPLPRKLRRMRRAIKELSIPAPKIVFGPLLWLFVSVRSFYHFCLRVFVCEPLFKAYCKSYGRGVHTDCKIHWIMGKGDICLGDDVKIDGKNEFSFGARFADRPLVEIGSGTRIGHACRFVAGKRITVGKRCNLSGGTVIMDSNGHGTEVQSRVEHKPPADDEVRPVTIGDDVWIGMHCIIFPGVKIGNGSVISAGSIVRMHVPPYSVVAGNPAKVMFRLKKSEAPAISFGQGDHTGGEKTSEHGK